MMSSSSPGNDESWKVWYDASTGSAWARFAGHLGAEAGLASASRFAQLIKDQPVDVVFDISAMTGYDSPARVAWKDALWPRRKLIRSLRIVGGNAIVRMGAQILGLALGVSVKS